jgi:hypothetical protein
MFEHKSQPLAPRHKFYFRLARHFAWTLLVVGFSLAIGSAGYHFIARLSWIDVFYNSAMIVTGRGPVSDTPMRDTPSKLFSAFYALYSGVAFLSKIATLLAPSPTASCTGCTWSLRKRTKLTRRKKRR